MHRRQLVLDTVLVEQGDFGVLVDLHPFGMAGDEELHELLGDAVLLIALDDDLLDVAVIEITDRAFDQARFLVDEGRRCRLQCRLANAAPKANEVFVVALDFRLAATGASSAHDHRHALRYFQLVQHLLQTLAVGGGGDLAGNAAPAGGIWHQHAVAAGEGKIGGQRCALVAALFLGNLHQHDLPALDHFLNLVEAAGRTRPAALHLLFVVGSCLSLGFFGLFPFPLGALRGLLGKQSFAIGNRDLVVVGVDFVKGEKAVAIATVIDEGGLQRWLDACHLRQIDIALQLTTGGNLDIVILNPGSVEHHNPGLFRVRRIDEHGLAWHAENSIAPQQAPARGPGSGGGGAH